MIIGIDGHMIGDHSGGNESYYSNILKKISVGKDDTFYLFVKKSADVSLFEGKFKIVRFESESAFKRHFVELPRLCLKYHLDILHTQYFVPFYRPCPTVCTIHDICFEHYKNIFTKKEYMRQKILIPYAAKHSKVIFTVSENAKNDISERYKIDKNKIVVTYNAVSDSFRRLSPNDLNEIELRKKFGIGGAPYILSVGNLQPRKNLPRLIQAFVQFKRETRDCVTKLVIVGKKAWMYSEIINAVNEMPNDIILTDYVSETDLIRLYNAATCFVYPSFFEGFGIPPLEAMACGTPVAVANATSLPEVVGKSGLYFDPFNVEDIKNTIIDLMTDKKLRGELAEKGYQQKEQFSWQESADKWTEAYSRIVNK